MQVRTGKGGCSDIGLLGAGAWTQRLLARYLTQPRRKR